MTYCCGILVRDGLVMIADTRTNAGLDNISVFRKLHTYTLPGERVMAMVYSAGNFIECTIDTPYLQIGEHKYGKPVLDRAITHDTDLYDALKIGLISVDSTMRSNLSVGMPLDLLVMRRDTLKPELAYRIEPGEPYFQDLRQRWSAALRAAHRDIPRPPYVNQG